MARRKYRRNYQIGGKQKGGFFSLMKKIINKTGGVKDKQGRRRKLNPKHHWRRPNEPYFLPLKQKGGFSKKWNYH